MEKRTKFIKLMARIEYEKYKPVDNNFDGLKWLDIIKYNYQRNHITENQYYNLHDLINE